MDYTTLIADKTTDGSIRRWVNHSDVDAVTVLTEAQALIFQSLRVREMRTVFSDIAMAIGNSSTALPSGFLDPIALIDKTNNLRLRLRTEEFLSRLRQYDTTPALVTGTPQNFAIFGEALQFDLAYDAVAILSLIAFATPAPLGPTNTTNFLTNRIPHVLACACRAQAFAFRNNDERQQLELQKLAAYIAKTNAESDLSYRGLEVSNEVF
jgi:hypothetical protein